MSISIDEAADQVNAAYAAEDYDLYDALLARYAAELGKPVWQFEDDCTDIRILGHGRA